MSSRPVIAAYNTGFPTGSDLVRLHLNETPYGAPPAASAAARAELDERCAVYPDSDCSALRARIAAHHGVGPETIAVGNGVDELVLLTALTFLGPQRTALVTDTTFPGYLTATAAAGGRVRTVPLDAHHVSPAALGAALAEGADLVFVCNPVNPTGTALTAAGVERIIADAEAHDAIAVFDEAYLDFAGPDYDHALAAVRAGRPVLVLRTFSKAWGLAALRAGYAVGRADLVARLWHTRNALPFNVNRLAQRAAAAALDDPGFLQGVRERTADARHRLYRGLTALGVEYTPSVTNFVLVRTGGDSGAIAARLAAEHRILIRDLTLFGLPGHVRITVGTTGQIDALCAALGQVLSELAPQPDAPAAAAHWDRPVPTLAPMDVAAMFNGYVGAHVVFALRELGVWDELGHGPATVAALCAGSGADRVRLRALLRSAALLGHLELRDDVATLTAAGRDVAQHRGYFTWAVGGYGEMMRELPALTAHRDGARFRRDEAYVASGSAECGRAMISPMESEVLAGLDYASVADLGCGDGSRLIGLCGDERRGLGIDISEAACALAAKRVAEAGLGDHIEIACQNIFEGEDRAVFPGIDLVSSFLMMHDLFAAMPGVEVVHALRAAFPDARYFLLADTNAQPWAAHEGPLPPFSLAFELAHSFMRVPVQPKELYEEAFRAGGLIIERRVKLGVPSSWLYLLRVPQDGERP